jgi:hypothetical protein
LLSSVSAAGKTPSSRSRHKSLESPVHLKVPAGFGGRLRGKGRNSGTSPRSPILLLHDVEVACFGDQDVVEAFPAQVPMNRS